MPLRAQPLPTFGPLSTVRYTVDGVDFDMVRVPPGRFVDGEGATRRELLVSRPFELGVAPVTQALWRAVMGSNPSKFIGEDLPVESVRWEAAQGFLDQLRNLGLSGFRLSAEAEWAWAVRCGAPTRWAGADRAQSVATVKVQQTAPVAGLSSSAVGAFDFSGNVLEWQQDLWTEAPLAGFDIQGPASGLRRVHRSGGWYYGRKEAQVAVRGSLTLRDGFYDLGFRLLRRGL